MHFPTTMSDESQRCLSTLVIFAPIQGPGIRPGTVHYSCTASHRTAQEISTPDAPSALSPSPSTESILPIYRTSLGSPA